MNFTDFLRFFGLLILFAAIEIIQILLGLSEPHRFDTDRANMAAAFIVILWAIRDGQKRTTPTIGQEKSE
jgi:hypothetical protein